jgi:caffeoyl-CoA O-methyltransferase
MDLIHPLAQAYAERYSSQEDSVLRAVAASTTHTHAQAHMLSGHLQGTFLQIISQVMQPNCILEIGTFTGYSAISLSKGLQAGGLLHTIELREQWDLVFIDADKTGYIQYYDLVLPKLRKGGIILADNVLFHGKVLENTIHGKTAKAIQAFNEHVSGDDSVEKVLLTIRDGLLMIIKK